MLNKIRTLFLLTTLNIKHASNRKMATYASDFYLKRHTGVEGTDGKTNDIIVCRANSVTMENAREHVIFFGGDIQNYPEEMERPDIMQYSKWNLESTAMIIAKRFPHSAVFIVKPAYMFLNTFSIYSNFLPFSEDGIPDIGGQAGSVDHLVKLYQNCLLKETKCGSERGETLESQCSADSGFKRLSVVGFSKGCVVVNQLMFDLDPNSTDPSQRKFVENLHSVYWLDSGHVGDHNAWITDDVVLKKLTSLNLHLEGHVTPYQVRDSLRVWIAVEFNDFVKKLKELKADFKDVRHFFAEHGSIENHFNVLKKF